MSRSRSRTASGRSSSGRSAKEHTVIIGDAVTMWEKLYWDVDVFTDIQRNYPTERQPISYAAINVCISTWSLARWVQREITRRDGKQAGDAFRHSLFEWIPVQGRCEDIANTAKHASHRDELAEGARADLRWEEGDEYAPAGLTLYHVDKDGRVSLAFDTFSKLVSEWWHVLVKVGLAEGDQRSPEWLQGKITRMFGRALSNLTVLPPGAFTTSETGIPPADDAAPP